MNISFQSFANPISVLFKEQAEHFLNTQQKKISAIAILILSGVALYFVIKRCCFRATVIPPLPPFVSPPGMHPKSAPSTMPKGYEWIKNKKDAKQFMRTVKEISTLTDVALSLTPIYKMYPELHVHIGDIFEYATLDQIEPIVIALAQHSKVTLLRDVFYYLFKKIEENPDSDIDKEKLRAVLQGLSKNQLMDLLYIDDQIHSDAPYQRVAYEISELPLDAFLKWQDEFAFPKEFINGCKKLLQYRQDIQSEIKKEGEKEGYLCG